MKLILLDEVEEVKSLIFASISRMSANTAAMTTVMNLHLEEYQLTEDLSIKSVVSDRVEIPTTAMSSSCSICLQKKMILDDLAKISDCNHLFHVGCLEEWILNSASCPLCRAKVRSS